MRCGGFVGVRQGGAESVWTRVGVREAGGGGRGADVWGRGWVWGGSFDAQTKSSEILLTAR